MAPNPKRLGAIACLHAVARGFHYGKRLPKAPSKRRLLRNLNH